MADNIRIRTTPNGSDQYLKVKIEQDFDFIEILSLNISQDKAYENFCADYGVVVGRVVINNGFGVPNVKISVFIPLDDVDKNDPLISGIYPYEVITDKDMNGVRYNLLPKESDSQDDCYTPTGTFSAKREVLDNPDMLKVYTKYYKFTTQTNYAGDFMIFGVPLGNHTVHVDMDISNIGIASQRPYDLIEQGAPQKLFYSPTKFKESNNLNSLPQIKTTRASVNVQPFWGDAESCQVGINRLDFDMNYQIKPAAIFTGGLFGDNEKNSINKGCRPRRNMGRICEQMPAEGTIEMIRKTLDDEIEEFDVDGGRVVDNNGAWAYQIPMNLDYVVTDEYGRLIPSEDPNIGIPTRARVRFKISMDEGGGLGRLRTRAKYLVPHNPATLNDLDFNFDSTTSDKSFTDLHWNKIYTVKSLISNTRKIGLESIFNSSQNFLGIKQVDDCGDKSPFPYNRAYTTGDPLFFLLCIILNIISTIVYVVNTVFICLFCRVLCLPFGIGCPLCGVAPHIALPCPKDDGTTYYEPGACGDSATSFLDCIEAVLADKLGLFQFDFYNDWINGSLYFYLLKYKRKRNGSAKFCETYCEDFSDASINSCRSNALVDSTFYNDASLRYSSFQSGHIVNYNDELFYSPVILGGNQHKLYPTDITNLGAIFDCDWQGFPKIIDYLEPTSYKLPPLLPETSENNENEQYVIGGMFTSQDSGFARGAGLFFDVYCFPNGVVFNSNQAANIRRICELGVDIPEWLNGTQAPTAVSIYDIYDVTDTIEQATSIRKYTRDSFTILNINGSGISSLPQYTANDLGIIGGTSFNTSGDHLNVRHVNGNLYNQFRNYYDAGNNPQDMAFQAWGGSYYMYFGVLPGKTGLDKLRAKYFTPCVKKNLDDYVIRTNITNTSSNTGKDGKIEFTFIGGTGPFTYSWVGPNYTYGPIKVNSNDILTGLSTGVYTITAVDVLGTIVTKEVFVSGPQPLKCDYRVFAKPHTQQTADGSIDIIQMNGGTPPYTLNIQNANGNFNKTYNNASIQNTAPLNGLSADTYTLMLTDSSKPVQTCTKTLKVTAPEPLVINEGELNINNSDCFCNGSVVITRDSITGGVPPYTITYSTTGQIGGSTSYLNAAGNFTGATITGQTSPIGMCKAHWKMEVKDSYGVSAKPLTFDMTGPDTKLTFVKPQITTITNSGNQYQVYIPEDGVSGGAGGYEFKPSPDSSLGVCGVRGSQGIFNKLCGFYVWPTKITVTDDNNCSVTVKSKP